jgi:type VI secretion system protein ImpH
MASAARQATDPVALLNALRDTPEAFEFFEALRRLECAFPDRPRLGMSTRSAEDFIRMGQTPSLAFPPRMIDRFEPGSGGRAARLYGLFFGLFGPHGPLPLHLTEYTLERAHSAKDRTFSAFADVFHHRMMCLFYRAWADSQPTVQFDRPAEDRFGLYVGAMAGLGTPALKGRDSLPDHFKRYFAGRLQQQTRNAEGLRCLLESFFRVPVAITEFVAARMALPSSAYLRLGSSSDVAALGRTTVVGESVWGCQQRFRLRLGPLNFTDFSKFLPGADALGRLVAAVRTYAGDEKAWDVQLLLDKDAVPGTRLGQAGRLGLTTWMSPVRRPAPADDVVLRPVG